MSEETKVLRLRTPNRVSATELLEDLARSAQGGDLVACSVVWIRKDGSLWTGWSGDQTILEVLGAVEILAQDARDHWKGEL